MRVFSFDVKWERGSESPIAPNTRHTLESAVFTELQRRRAEIAYVKTASGFEVDFLVRYPDGTEEFIQVCASIDDPETPCLRDSCPPGSRAGPPPRLANDSHPRITSALPRSRVIDQSHVRVAINDRCFTVMLKTRASAASTPNNPPF